MSFKNRFSNLGQPNRIWTVSAIHGQLRQLTAIHDSVFHKFQSGDRIVYTGNYLCGAGAEPLATMDALLLFRRTLLAVPGVVPEDIVFLRGAQEELWSKTLQLQFAPSPRQVLEWMQERHPEMNALLGAYNTSLEEAQRVGREGILSLTRWTSALKMRMREHHGHENFFNALRRAAFTEFEEQRNSNDNNLLFVHAGLNPTLPLLSQGDNFWWVSKNFNDMAPYSPFRTVIRGYDPEGNGLHIGKSSVSLDGGAARGGKLVCAQMSPSGEVMELLAA